ncbi:MAG: hypothetical protein ACJAS1_006243 [Oleiphilaceae bacterium]|jgi:hypothetical protein
MKNLKKKVGNRVESDFTLSALLMPEQVAGYLNVSTRTLANWRSTGANNLPYSKIGRCIRYRQCDIDNYIAKHSHNIGEGPGNE